jgi:hypothetical protein
VSKDSRDLALHFALGAVIGAVELLATGSAVMAVVWAAAISFARESEQARYQRVPFRHPSDVRNWSPHRWREFVAIPLGALAAIAASRCAA